MLDQTILIQHSKMEKNKGVVKDKLITGTGRRKTAVATVFLYEKKGEFSINNTTLNEYFSSVLDKDLWLRPFHIVGISHPESAYSASIRVSGSGLSSQLDAVVLGISRALASISEENRVSLRKNGLLTRDSRMVERKKPFLKKARKRPQYSKR